MLHSGLQPLDYDPLIPPYSVGSPSLPPPVFAYLGAEEVRHDDIINVCGMQENTNSASQSAKFNVRYQKYAKCRYTH